MKTHIIIALMISAITSNAQVCETGVLDARVAETLRTVLTDLPSSPTTSVEQIRDVKIQSPPFPASDLTLIKVTGDSIPIQIYNPWKGSNLPIIISYHPGGFVTPVLPFMQYEFWRQAKIYHAIVFAVDYRVAPEHPYPSAVNDSYNGFKWIVQNGRRFGGDVSKLAILGSSAGGNLAAVVCQKAVENGLQQHIKLQILNCASTDNPKNSSAHPSYQKYASGYFLNKAFCQYYINVYAANEDIENPEVAPLHRKNLSGLPPAVIITAEFDVFRDEGFKYAERLKTAGIPVVYKCFPGQIHCLLGLPPDANELKELDEMVVDALEQRWK
jgi:acetyl esterase